MTVTSEYLAYVIDQLRLVGSVSARRMFGGAGLYFDGLFFGLIDDDVVYFKVGDSNRDDYERAGMRRFRPFPDQPQYEMGYYEVPADALDDPEELAAWARKSLDVALAARALGPKRRPKAKQAPRQVRRAARHR